eukprot:NODE_5859_length_902_cov_4.281130_g5632_i0.p1 GENE.NODE_5859_length_902_cov_4.281130_g5632_i0~~NODE_5859_length_902_cov_4.281130_g5632_i0.p1  ORF type:complete len:295 (+),score=5.82 NODE_5859_length_902_cov_4.281130_g5632_i0:130-885(+)
MLAIFIWIDKIAHFGPDVISAALYMTFLCAFLLPIPESIGSHFTISYTIGQRRNNTKVIIVGCLYVALGYATTQSIAVLILLYNQFSTPLFGLVAFIAAFFAIGAPLHLFVAYGVALVIAKHREGTGMSVPIRTRGPFLRSFLFSYLTRCAYYALFVAMFMLEMPVWIFIICAFTLCVIMVFVIKWMERHMPPAFLARSGYFHAFGYGVISQVEDACHASDHIPVIYVSFQDNFPITIMTPLDLSWRCCPL